MTARRRGPRRRAYAQGVTLLEFFQLLQKAQRGHADDDQVREVLEASLPRWEAAHQADPCRCQGAGPAIGRWCERYGVEVPTWVAELVVRHARAVERAIAVEVAKGRKHKPRHSEDVQ